ncbi:hypothetical protein KC326_g5803 [Hortaea werneckii]|nr:hypothetical protein KC326_g5803 [Hortaea werneckii]
MAEPESPDPESGSDSRHGGEESDPYRPDPSPSDDEETLFLPGEQLLTEVDAGLNIEETGTQGRAGDQEQQTSTHSRGTKQRRKPKKRPTPLPSSSLSIEDPTPLPVDFDFPILTSVYWGNCPTTSEEYGTVEGENARLWMQAETDLALEDAPEVPVPGQKRPIDLLDVLDKRLRKIHSAVFRRTGNVGYTWFLVFSTTRAAIPKHCEKGYYRIEITPNREVISDVLFNGLDECQVEDIRQAIHPFFERLHTVPNIPSVFAPQAFPDLVAHDVCFVAPELQQKACRIMVFLQSMLHTRMIMRSGVRVYQNALLEWIGYRSFSKVAMKGKDSLYKGGSLVAVTSHAGHYSLDPSQTLQKDVQAGFFNTVRVPPSAAALLRCIEVLDTVYWKIGESEFVDAYSGVTQPYFESKSDWEARFPFLLSPDAIQPLCVYEGELAIHVVSNMLPTTWCLNKLKHIYGPILLHLMWQLSHSSASEQRLVIHRKIDHLYLIRLQLPYKRSSRMNLDPEDPLIVSVQTQNTAGIANPDECLKIKRPWALQSDNKTFSKSGRPTESRARVREFPLQSKVEALVLQIEERYNYAFKRIEGAVYLFNWDNRPVEWTWDDNRRFYSVMLERMIEECNKDYETTCTVDTLFLVHCLRVACPPKGLEWLYYELEPYTHHPFRASGGHAAHGLNMTTGWPEDYETLNDFVEEDCNIDIEPWIWNMMRGGLDHHYDAIVDYIRNLPRDNPPYWQESLGSGPPVPLTVWGGAVRQVRLRAKKRGPTGSTSGPDQPQETAMRDTGRQSSQRNVPTGAPQRGNLSNKDQICYASAIIQMLCNVPKLRALVSATSDLPFDVNTGRGLHGFVLLGDPGFAIHQSIFSQLRQIASTLEATNTRLPADCTLEFLRTLRQINTQTCREFPEAGEYDPSTLLGVLLEMLNDAGDRSQPLTDTVELRPNRVWLKNQEEAIKAGRLIAPLIEDVPLQFGIHKDIGNNSEVDDLCTLRVVYESVCSVEGCQSPFSRGFSFEQVLNLQFPQNDPAGVYKVSDLIENWSLGSGRAVCGYDNLHGLAMPAKKKILTTPEILFLRIERLSLGDLMTSGSIFEAENAAQIVSNPLIVEETIDLQPWCNRELPSERHLGPLPERLKPRTTHYGIEAIIQYKSRHFFTYAKAKDQDGNLFWAKFDDTLPTVVWENPLQIKHRTGDFILVYRLLSEAEVSEALAASETISTAHQSEHGEEFEEIEVIENLNAANETGDLSDYEDSIGDPVNIQDILNDDGDASEDDDDGPGDPEARKDNSKIPFEEYSHLKITFEEYSRKSGREKGEYIAGFFTTVAETAGSDGGAEVLFELAARVRFLGEELQAALDSRQSQKSSDREQSDWDAAVMAALQRQPKQFQDYIAELQTEIRKLEKEHQSLKRRLKESQSKTPKPSDDPTSRDDPTPRDDLTPGKRSKSKKKSGSRQPQFSEEEQSARTRLQNLMFEEHTINSQLSSMKKEVEAVREERDHLQQEIDTLRSRDPTSSSGLTSARPEDLVGQLRDQLQNLSPQSLGDLIQQATMELVSRTTMPSETPQKQLPAHVRATPGTQELNPATPFPVVSAPQSTPSTTLPASLSGATGTIPATVSGVGFPFSSDLQSLPTQHQSIGGPGQSTTPAPIFQTPTTPANVSAQPGGFNLPGQPSSTSQPGVMGPPGRTPQTGERRPYEMIRSTEASPSRQGGPESPFKRQFVGTTEPDTSASPSFSTPRHDLGPTPPAQYGAPQHHGAYQAGHTGPGAPPTYFMIPGGFFPYRTAPPPHAYNIQAPTTVPQTAPTAPSTVGSVEPPPTSNLPPSGPPPPAFNVTAPTTVSQAAPTISSNVGSVPAPQPTSRLPVPVRSSGTVAPSPGGTNPPAGPSQRGQEASPSAQPTTLPPPSGTSSGGGTASSQPGQGALPSAQPSTRPSPADTSSETAAGSTKPPQTTEGVAVQRAVRGVQGVVIVVGRVSRLTLEMGEGDVKRAGLNKAGLKIDLKIAWQK